MKKEETGKISKRPTEGQNTHKGMENKGLQMSMVLPTYGSGTKGRTKDLESKFMAKMHVLYSYI